MKFYVEERYDYEIEADTEPEARLIQQSMGLGSDESVRVLNVEVLDFSVMTETLPSVRQASDEELLGEVERRGLSDRRWR